MKEITIKKVTAGEVLDSRGNPTVGAEVELSDGTKAVGIAPSGASTGIYEALELRDKDAGRYCGKGVTKAVANVNGEINDVLWGMDASDIRKIDAALIAADGTNDKAHLGANAIIAVSIAAARAAAVTQGLPLYKYLGGMNGVTLPVPMMNILNGGEHASNNLDVQEFMIMPVGAKRFSEGLRWCAEVYASLKSLLKSKGLSVSVGDEGGFAPDLDGDEMAIELVLEGIRNAGYEPRRDFVIALDAAASGWKTKETGVYKMPKSGKMYSTEQLIAHYQELCRKYPIRSIEDGLDEEDWAGWSIFNGRLGGSVQIVGDDLFVTNTKRLKKGIEAKSANAVLIKLNQIGTVTETMDCIRMAQRSGFGAIISHRSGETEDTTIADLAVAMNAGQIKTGAPCRTERVAKYNRLLKIEAELGAAAVYLGNAAFRQE